jgi:hypothetical protein
MSAEDVYEGAIGIGGLLGYGVEKGAELGRSRYHLLMCRCLGQRPSRGESNAFDLDTAYMG